MAPELMRTLAQTGLTTPFPEAYGGSGPVEAITYALIVEELAFGDGGLAASFIGSLMGPVSVALAGSEEQRARLLPPFGDERSNSTLRGSLAFAERTGGYTLADISATLRRDGDGYRLTGTKRGVIHGDHADLRIVLARLEGTSGPHDLCALVLPAAMPGMQVRREMGKLGLLAASSAAYTCDLVCYLARRPGLRNRSCRA
jgi:alkylation response protein AidB-like acyl-CoA dehydrogenase